MNAAYTGASVGLLLGVVSYITLSTIAGKLERDGRDAEKKSQAALIRNIARFEILLFAVVGYFVGPLVLE